VRIQLGAHEIKTVKLYAKPALAPASAAAQGTA
jgi:hypothetical protein